MDKRGSITVEMTLLMITILGITFGIMLTGMYMYDMNRLQMLAERFVLQTAEELEEGRKVNKSEKDWEAWSVESLLSFGAEDVIRAGILKDTYDQHLKSGFFYLGDVQTEAAVSGGMVSLRVSGEWKCPLGLFFLADIFTFDFTSEKAYGKSDALYIIHGVLRGLGG